MVKNAFFDLALQQASRLLGRKSRMLMLIARFGVKLKEVDWTKLKPSDVKSQVKDKTMLIFRLFRAYALGKYRNIPWKPLLLLTAAIIYFISPLDLIPDFLVGVGFTDDFAILLMVYDSIHHELEKFITWENSQVIES